MNQKEWWKIGFILTVFLLLVWIGIGLPWMKLIGLF
jgi:DASS family divalent anion:Na+ symporter